MNITTLLTHVFIWCTVSLLSCGQAPPQAPIQGVCLTGPSGQIGDSAFVDIQGIGADWVCLMPYAYGPRKSGEISFNEDWQWWGESEEGTREMIGMAKGKGMQVMLKPHLWLDHGSFTGNFDPGSEVKWQAFEKSYANYILLYARLAQELEVEVFCIGTELRKFVESRPAFWIELLKQVKVLYKGKITYAANWDEVQHFPYWKQMDYVGVDGYFPLTDGPSNDLNEMRSSWQKHFAFLDSLSEKLETPFLFTELGYRSCVDCATKPWEFGMNKKADSECQVLAYQAFFESRKKSKYYAGAFIWKWHANLPPDAMHGAEFTPQHKPAYKLIFKEFSQ